MDKPHPAHIRGQLIHLLKRCYAIGWANRHFAVLRSPKVEDEKLICFRSRELWLLDIDAPDPVALLFQSLNKVTRNESARTADHGSSHGSSVPFSDSRLGNSW